MRSDTASQTKPLRIRELRADRDAGLSRLESFLPRAGRQYAATRNYDHGPSDRSNVSMLSPYLRHRLVSEREVLVATLERHGRKASEKFVQEVFWRAYFKGWLERRPEVWKRYRDDVAALIKRLDRDGSFRARYEQAIAGRTGIDCLDAWSAELVETGYLHNHARMWFASIWVYTLELPWQLGADFFLRHLIDGDPASNTLSWRWVCGLHTRGKTYVARASNIARYTNGRFNPEGRLAETAAPLVEADLAPLPAPVPQVPATHARDAGRIGLLVTEEDCLPDTLALDRRPAAVLGLLATDARSPMTVGVQACAFATGAVADALSRAELRYGTAGAAHAADEWGRLLVDWAAACGITTIATAYPPQGPVSDRLRAALPALAEAGLGLAPIRRRYDIAAWPHANRGYFKLKAKIPSLLAALQRD